MTIELNEKELEDIKQGLLIAMKLLDQGNNADLRLSDRLEVISKRLDNKV